MKTKFNLAAILICLIGLFFVSNASALNNTETGNGQIKVLIMPKLKITPFPYLAFPTNGERPKIGRGDTRIPPQTLYVEYTIEGEKGADIVLSTNGNGNQVTGSGVSFTTTWKFRSSSWYGATESAFSNTTKLSDDQGAAYVRVYIETITASNDATLGNNQIELKLTASYSY